MKSEKLIDAIGMVGDDLIGEAKNPRKRTIRWQPIAAAAACLALIICIVFSLLPEENITQLSGSTPTDGTTIASTPSTTLSTPNTSLSLPTDTIPGTNPPENDYIIPITVRVESGTPGNGFVGNYNISEISGGASEPYPDGGVTAIVKVIEFLPDTYYIVREQMGYPFRLIRMRTEKTLYGKGMVQDFYYLMREEYTTDLTLYDTLIVMDLQQYGYENSILYNQTAGCFEAFEFQLFGQSYGPNPTFIAFNNGIFDESLWTTNQAWQTAYSSHLHDLDEITNSSLVARGWTIKQVENTILTIFRDDYFRQNLEVYSLSSPQSNEVSEALAYIKPFSNGIFIPELNSWKLAEQRPNLETYRRYLEGYPTNETVRLRNASVYYSTAKFTDEDTKELPDLASALHAVSQAYDAGQIKPPHITDAENQELLDYSIFGWYAKTDTGVYGIVRVDWCYDAKDIDFKPWGLLDDKYYIIAVGSDELIPIERNALLELVGSDGSYIFNGEYDQNGKLYDVICY